MQRGKLTTRSKLDKSDVRFQIGTSLEPHRLVRRSGQKRRCNPRRPAARLERMALFVTDAVDTPSSGPSPRVVVGCFFVVIVAGLMVGLLSFGGYFVAEHRRLDFWQGVLVWLGDLVALSWFTIYFVRHFLLGVSIRGPAGSARRAGVLWWLALLSIVLSLSADLWITLSLRQSEREAFAGARHTVGTINTLKKTIFPARVHYALHCTYVDANQVVHTTVFQLRDPDELPRLNPAVVKAIRAEQLPAPVAIAYDMDRLERSWLAELGWQDPTRMLGFSLSVLMFQTIASAGFLIKLAAVRSSTGVLPWWYDLHGVLLVAVEASFVLLFGSLGLLFGLPFVWGDL